MTPASKSRVCIWAALAFVAGVALLVPATSFGWSATTNDDHIVLVRDAGDTTVGSWRAFRIAAVQWPTVAGAADHTPTVSWAAADPATVYHDADLKETWYTQNGMSASYSYLFIDPDGGRHVVKSGCVSSTRVYAGAGAGSGMPLYVRYSHSGTLTETVDVREWPDTSEGTSVTVSVEASGASFDGTMTVDPWSTAGMPEGWQVAVVLVAMLVAGGVIARELAR